MNTSSYLEMLKSDGGLEKEKFTVILLSIMDTTRLKEKMYQLSFNKATPEKQQSQLWTFIKFNLNNEAYWIKSNLIT